MAKVLQHMSDKKVEIFWNLVFATCKNL
jgi:hypothetical protein